MTPTEALHHRAPLCPNYVRCNLVSPQNYASRQWKGWGGEKRKRRVLELIYNRPACCVFWEVGPCSLLSTAAGCIACVCRWEKDGSDQCVVRTYFIAILMTHNIPSLYLKPCRHRRPETSSQHWPEHMHRRLFETTPRSHVFVSSIFLPLLYNVYLISDDIRALLSLKLLFWSLFFASSISINFAFARVIVLSNFDCARCVLFAFGFLRCTFLSIVHHTRESFSIIFLHIPQHTHHIPLKYPRQYPPQLGFGYPTPPFLFITFVFFVTHARSLLNSS